MTRFLLVRHGHTDWIGKALAGHTPGVALSAEGQEQVRRTTEHLRRAQVAAVYSSPLQRTVETARMIATALGCTLVEKQRLIEVNFGRWTGRTMKELEDDPLWQRFNTLRSSTRAPGGDLMLEVQSRMVDELEELRAQHRDQTVVVVSHQDAIKAALAHYAGIPLDLFHRFEVWPASVSVLEIADWGPRIRGINLTGDLF